MREKAIFDELKEKESIFLVNPVEKWSFLTNFRRKIVKSA